MITLIGPRVLLRRIELRVVEGHLRRGQRHPGPAVGLHHAVASRCSSSGVEAVDLAGELGVVRRGVEVRDAVDAARRPSWSPPTTTSVSAPFGRDHADAGDHRVPRGVGQRHDGVLGEDRRTRARPSRPTPPAAPRAARRSSPTGSRRSRWPVESARPDRLLAGLAAACSRGRTRGRGSPSSRSAAPCRGRSRARRRPSRSRRSRRASGRSST